MDFDGVVSFNMEISVVSIGFLEKVDIDIFIWLYIVVMVMVYLIDLISRVYRLY